jgi:hypothetical protein
MTHVLKLELKIGIILFALFLLQVFLNWHMPGLTSLQGHETFKFITGFIFAGYIGYQWRLTKIKSQKQKVTGLLLRETLQSHKFWGIIGPFFFYLHTQKMGYSYLFVLSVIFFAIYILGIFHERLVKLRKPWITQLSLISHIGLSTAMVALICYHALIAIYY